MEWRRPWFLNRVVLGLIAMFVLVGFREFKWKPQYRSYYEDAIRLYQSGNYREAQQQLDKAYNIAPNAVDVIVMEGWAHLKQNQLEDARFYFTRAVRIDPRTEEAQIGLAFVALETGRGELDPKLLANIVNERKGDANVSILLAGALERQGSYFAAQQIYDRLLSNKDYSAAAQLELQNIFGLRGFSDTAPESFAAMERPADLQVRYRASDGAFWKTDAENQWSKFYLQGVDLGAGAPGYLPASLPNEGAIYSDWLDAVAQLNANTLRVYTLLPPSFYRALHHQVASGKNLALIQQIWVADPPAQDLFDSGFENATKADIRHVVDAIHGHGAVPPEPGRGSGVYEFDLAAYVGAFLIGRDLEPQVVAKTNLLNVGERSYQGKYLSVAQATPTEVWLVEMADYLIDYETSTYNWQHPVAMLSGPAPDPADGDFLEDRVKQQPSFRAGLLAAYPAYPFYPEYMEKNAQYASARDSEGIDPVSGFVRELRQRLTVPLVVSEYGVSSSMEPRRVLASGWNQGGYSEDAQAEALGRLTRSLRESGPAGALAFELTDEWHRYGWIPEGFETPEERSTLWLNDLDPAKRYGLIGYRTSKWQLFTGDPAAWQGAAGFYASSESAESEADAIRGIDLGSDEGYLYLRLRVACLDCTGRTHTGKPQFGNRAFAIALNTLPGSAGIQQLPFGNVTLSTGANFLIVLRGPKDAQMLTADDYNPFQMLGGSQARTQLNYKRTFVAGLHPSGNFMTIVAQQGYELSQLTYGNGNPGAADYDSRGEWYADVKHSAILLRIPWGKLLVTDPSSMLALAGHDNNAVRARPTTGVQVSAYALEGSAESELNKMKVSFAAPVSGRPQVFTWRPWNTVAVAPFRKKAFFALQREYAQSVAMGQPNALPALAHGTRMR
jgi:tetratricopeptide (TPR) repeat protein